MSKSKSSGTTKRPLLLAGRDRLEATTAVLQRARRADPSGGVWEAADVQWWWRRPRASDAMLLPVWFDASGPVAAVGLTEWDTSWSGDVHLVPSTIALEEVWAALVEARSKYGVAALDVLAREDDDEFVALLKATGFASTGDRSTVNWMSATDRPPVTPPPEGFIVSDRASRPDRPHPMRARSGVHVEARLQECSLYDAELDLAVETIDGDPAGYALFWFDQISGVGMIEPMRVEDRYQRQGLARALLTEGMERLAKKGARRLKVGSDGDAGRNLYLGAGFIETATLRAFRSSSP